LAQGSSEEFAGVGGRWVENILLEPSPELKDIYFFSLFLDAMAPITGTRSQAAARKNFEFSLLPTELRLMIWKETFEPRILHITSEATYSYDQRSAPRQSLDDSDIDNVICAIRYTHIRFKAPEKPPLALQICHESRTLALKHYTPSFYSTTSSLRLEVTGEMTSPFVEMDQAAIYFNPELDTVHIREDFGNGIYYLSKRTNQETTQSVKVLAVQFLGNFLPPDLTRYLSRHLRAFERLETIVLLAFEWDAESTRKDMEGILNKTHDSLRLMGECAEWKVPAVKVMNLRAFESSW
jgi:hypothetical protein